MAGATEADIDEGLAELGRYFELARLLSERRDRNVIARYFNESAPLYFLAHSIRGAMHMALNDPRGSFKRSGYRAQALMVERHVRMLRADRVLELGCGRGFNLIELARRNAGVSFAGLDLTPWHVRAARLAAWRHPNVAFDEGDFHRLPYDDGCFDVVFSVEAICHADDVYEVGEEVRRVLRPGGRFITIEPWRSTPFESFGDGSQMAVRLVEQAWVLPNLQEHDRWLEHTLRRGFSRVAVHDLTAAAVPNVEKLRRQAWRWRRVSWGRRAVCRLRPYLMQNALAAIALAHCVYDDVGTGPICYRLTVLDRRHRVSEAVVS